ncbi:MAG: DNA polymerase III subunit gamma/tau [Anaerohalosphaeraceae bacterium]|jgi:DNA polymerase-3 subunit gamma/tau
MAYTVIARRYRSQTFDDVVGQDAVAQTLKNAIEMGRVAHAYLFCGTRGVGKTTMARVLAKSMNCLEADAPTVTPCLKCDSCVSVNAGEDIDVIEIDGASNNGVDNIRKLRENAIYRPARARFKIYIIDEVHMLSPGAFNALLKILEEPPEHVKFIFATTEPNKVLATIQSRCQRFDFQSIGAEVIGRQLEMILKDEKIRYEKDLIVHLSRLANGSMRDALSLLDQLISAGAQPLTSGHLNELVGTPDRQKVMSLLFSIAGHDAAATLDVIDQLIDNGQSSGQICDLLIQTMRDMMVLQSAGADSKVLLLTDEEKQQLQQISESFDVAALVYNITALEKLRWTLRTSETSRALLEASLVRLTLSEHFIGLDRLSAQLTAGLSTGLPLKKKIATGNPTPAVLVASPESASTQPLSSAAADIATIQSSWKTIAEQCAQSDSSLGAFLVQGKPVRFDDSTLFLCFGSDGSGQLAQNACQRKLTVLQSSLSRVLSKNITVRIESVDSRSTLPEKKPPDAASATEATGINRQQRQQALNDPAVQMILKGLDATPVEIQKIDIQPDHDHEDGLIDQEVG